VNQGQSSPDQNSPDESSLNERTYARQAEGGAVTFRTKLVIAAAALITMALAFALYRIWQGPSLPAYTIQAQPLVQTVVGTGSLTALSRAKVGSEIIGVVLERRVKEGDVVAPGAVLLVLRSDELAAQLHGAEAALAQLEQSTRPQAQLAAQQAQTQYEQATRETRRRRALIDRKLIAQETLEQAVQAEKLARTSAERAALAALALAPGNAEETVLRERLAAARALLAKTVIKAEVAGTVLTREVEPGDLVQPGRVLLEIARSGGSEILLPLDEKNLSVLEVGQAALCVADAFPDQAFAAEVSDIAPSVDAQRGTIEVRLQVPDLSANFREGMTVSVNVQTGARDQALAIPNDALNLLPDGQVSVLRVTAGKVTRTPVSLGLRGLVMTEVLTGLSSGDRVLADGQTDLPDGSRVRVTDLALPMPAADRASARELPVSFN